MSMDRRSFLGSLAATAVAARAQPNRPNIIFILADDLGYGDLGCYGQQRIETPNIDRLAVEGMKFTQAYAGACVCAPSLSCLMTGTHGGHTRLRDNIPHGVFLRPDDVTVAEVLKQAGYTTAGYGKWSLGNPGSQGIPIRQGFDEYFGHLNQDQAHFYYPDYLWNNDQVELLFGNRGVKRTEYAPDLFTERALDFIGRNRERPFFSYLAYTLPHWSDYDKNSPESQIVPSDRPYSNEKWPQVEKNYAAMVTRLDRDVGRIMERLKNLGLDTNTLVIFTSDNGPSAEASHRPAFFNSAGPLRGVKRDMYEGAMRVPMIARWPGKIEAGAVTDHVCAFWDILPTFAELAGVPAPEGIDGISIVPALLGQPQADHEYFYWDYGHVRETYKQAVRMGDWKGVRVGARAPLELYDLSEDPGETKNVADQLPNVVVKIEEILKKARVATPDYPIKALDGSGG